ncbi:MAG: ATP-dependent RNA helicase [Myxococcales bacterium]|nr:ATP-dependent RNA helicase [Myxococcales bacterium]
MTRPAPLPITPILPQVLDAARRGPVVVSAATGSGKSTCVPPTLTALGRVLVIEPRRVACRALASRVAELRGCRPGTDVGWIVRDERRVDDGAAITFVTPGVALRLVQSGDIDRYGAVVLDEFHERAFDTDLLLCLLQERRALPPRGDVHAALVVMSATIQGDRLASHLRGVHIVGEGRTFPIEMRWAPGDVTTPSRRNLDERVLAALESSERDPGDVLVFLPGKAEIARVAQALEAKSRGRWDVKSLHGDMSLRDQGDVLEPGSGASRRRRVVLATNVAETSLTIPGIGVVIDGGLVRGMTYRAGRGYLSLLPIARDSADQRAGRAGRTGPGICIRLWSPTAQLAEVTLPEIHRESLVSLTLSALACSPRGMDLPWLDRPRPHAVAAALAELEKLGCVERGTITEAGLRLFALPLDVALARLLTQGAAVPGLAEPTLLLAAALSADRGLFRRAAPETHGAYSGPRRGGGYDGDDLRASGCDAVALIDAVRRGDAETPGLDLKALSEARAAADRFRKLGFGDRQWSGTVPRRPLAELLMKVWPGSAHVRRDQKRGRFTWASGGTEMELEPESAVRAADTDAVVVLDSRAVAAQGMASGLVITAAMPVPLAWLASAGLGDEVIGEPRFEDRALTVTISTVYAGEVLSTREGAPTGPAARIAVRDLTLAGRCFKGALPTLKERYELAELAIQVALNDRDGSPSGASTTPLAPLPDWLLQRLTDLGLESGADLALLDADDLMPPLPPEDVMKVIQRNYPRKLDIADAKYHIEYQLSERTAIFHQVGGTRKDPPPIMLLPTLPGLRRLWEHKNRVQPIGGRG